MSVNSSSPSNSSLDSAPFNCANFTVGMLITTAFSVTRAVLILPPSIFIIYLGCQHWRQQRSLAAASHSDVFTYHMAAMDLIWGLGLALIFCCSSADLPGMIKVGSWLSSVTYYGETFFHLLTCAERYLAVVHPVTYLGLRKECGVRIRNISLGCIWLLSFVWSGATNLFHLNTNFTTKSFSWLLLFSLVVVSFFSLSVLCALIRPGLGDGGQDKERVDQSKQKAFITIMVILGMLWLWFVGFLFAFAVEGLLSRSVSCVLMSSAFWFSLPSSLVLPLLYLHRAGKLTCGCFNSE